MGVADADNSNRRHACTAMHHEEAPAGALLLCAAVGIASLFTDYDDRPGSVPTERTAVAAAPAASGPQYDDWIACGRSGCGERHAPAAQITPANVSQLLGLVYVPMGKQQTAQR